MAGACRPENRLSRKKMKKLKGKEVKAEEALTQTEKRATAKGKP